MKPMLHIASGYSVAGTLKLARVPGKIAVWLDPLHAGPTSAGVEGEEWRRLRAEFVATLWDEPLDVVQHSLDEGLAIERFRDYQEVVLWVGAGLPDQLRLVRHLDWLASREHGNTKVSLIRVGGYPGWPGLLRGLGVLNAEQLLELLPERRPVTPGEYRLAQETWAAYRSPSPGAVESLLGSDTSALPYVLGALVWHLRRFPSVPNGLGCDQHECLASIPRRRKTVAWAVGTAMGTMEEWLDHYYLAWMLEGLACGSTPAVRIGERPPLPHGGTYRLGAPVALTRIGRDLLAGKADWVRLNGIDRWLGGVHLQGDEAAWRWDEDAGRLVGAHV